MVGVVQRVSNASVSVAGQVVAQIGVGLLVLAGANRADTTADARAIGTKLVGLRVFADDNGLMNRSVAEIGGGILLVSQFTLLGDVRKGRRPSFVEAAPPELAEPLIDEVRQAITSLGVPVRTGVFGAHMTIALVNEGPVTLILRSEAGRIA